MPASNKKAEGIPLSISKKLAAVVSAAAVVVSMFATSPANAESLGAYVNRTVSNDVDRTINPANHQIKYYAGEAFSLYYGGSISNSVLAEKVLANSVVSVDAGWTVVSGTMPTAWGKSAFMSGQVGNASFNEMMPQSSSDIKVSKTFTVAPNNLNFNVNISGTATTDIVFTFNPVVKIDDYVVTANDFNYSNLNAGSHSGGAWGTAAGSRVARAEDTGMDFFVDTACVDVTSLVSGDVLEATMPISDGTTTVGDFMPYWSMKNDQGMSNGPGGHEATYTYAPATGYALSINAGTHISSLVTGKTYTFQGFKVVKQGSTENLLTNCRTTGATGTVAVAAGVITATLDVAPDAGMMGSVFDSYSCQLYASTDTAHATVVKTGYAFAMGMGGPNSAVSCSFRGATAGTYVVGIRGSGWKGLGDEKILPGTVTIAGTVTPAAKKAPKVPTVVTNLKIGKSATVVLHATKGTASKGANADGLPTVVSVAAASKALCSVTKTVKSGKINGYTIKGLKAGKCSVVVTITGNATYNSLTKTIVVTVSK